MFPHIPGEVDGPTPADLAAIKAEWPLIEAEVDLLDAEIRVLTAERGPSVLDRLRLRRAEDRVVREAALFATVTGSAGVPVVALVAPVERRAGTPRPTVRGLTPTRAAARTGRVAAGWDVAA